MKSENKLKNVSIVFTKGTNELDVIGTLDIYYKDIESIKNIAEDVNGSNNTLIGNINTLANATHDTAGEVRLILSVYDGNGTSHKLRIESGIKEECDLFDPNAIFSKIRLVAYKEDSEPKTIYRFSNPGWIDRLDTAEVVHLLNTLNPDKEFLGTLYLVDNFNFIVESLEEVFKNVEECDVSTIHVKTQFEDETILATGEIFILD